MDIDEGAIARRIGQVIREARRDARLNQTELAEKIGMSQRQVSTWELAQYQGRPVTPAIDMLLRLEQAMDLPSCSLLVRAGLVDGISGVEQAINAATELDEDQKSTLLFVYRGWTRPVRRRRG